MNGHSSYQNHTFEESASGNKGCKEMARPVGKVPCLTERCFVVKKLRRAAFTRSLKG